MNANVKYAAVVDRIPGLSHLCPEKGVAAYRLSLRLGHEVSYEADELRDFDAGKIFVGLVVRLDCFGRDQMNLVVIVVDYEAIDAAIVAAVCYILICIGRSNP